MELWGLKEGIYKFQLAMASPDQPESMANITVTVTVLSTKQTEGEGKGGERASGATLPPC